MKDWSYDLAHISWSPRFDNALGLLGARYSGVEDPFVIQRVTWKVVSYVISLMLELKFTWIENFASR